LRRPNGAPTAVDETQVQEFLNKLSEIKHVALRKVEERLSRELKWDKRELPFNRSHAQVDPDTSG
jgi:hypothetical protein